MSLKLTVVSANAKLERRWVTELQAALMPVADARVRGYSESGELGEVVFLDGTLLGGLDSLALKAESIDRRGRAVFLIP